MTALKHPLLKEGTDKKALADSIATIIGIDNNDSSKAFVALGEMHVRPDMEQIPNADQYIPIAVCWTKETAATLERFTAQVREVIQPHAKGEFKIAWGAGGDPD